MKSDITLHQATHEGALTIGENTLPVAVLDDGTRLISYSSVFKAFGRTKRGAQKDSSRVKNMPAFLNSNNLQPFISKELIDVLAPIEYLSLTGKESKGYKAQILPLLCDVYLEARNSTRENGIPVLTTSQIPIAKSAEILIRSLSKVGIIALVDEATGYQYDRERNELQKILKAYISEELLAWQKRFPDVFYREIFRLNGWDYTVSDIKKRPGVIGKWTNKIIYEQLPKGVLKELKEKTPKSESGNYTARFHQSLTQDIGNPHLQAQINSVIPLMQISDNWQQFLSHFNKMVDRRNGQTEIKFEDLEYKGEPKKIEDTKFNRELKSLLAVPKPK